MVKQPKILPCPFCGHDEASYDPEVDMAFCTRCHAESGIDGLRGWNNRDAVGALHALLRHLRSEGIPVGIGDNFRGRLAKIPVPVDETADANFHRELTEALVLLLKRLRATPQAEEASVETKPEA